jgi:hypothetical protein
MATDGSALSCGAAERRAWRDDIYEVIQAMTTSRSQGDIGIERMCQLVGISRSGYYRHWQRSAPRQRKAGKPITSGFCACYARTMPLEIAGGIIGF